MHFEEWLWPFYDYMCCPGYEDWLTIAWILIEPEDFHTVSHDLILRGIEAEERGMMLQLNADVSVQYYLEKVESGFSVHGKLVPSGDPKMVRLSEALPSVVIGNVQCDTIFRGDMKLTLNTESLLSQRATIIGRIRRTFDEIRIK